MAGLTRQALFAVRHGSNWLWSGARNSPPFEPPRSGPTLSDGQATGRRGHRRVTGWGHGQVTCRREQGTLPLKSRVLSHGQVTGRRGPGWLGHGARRGVAFGSESAGNQNLNGAAPARSRAL